MEPSIPSYGDASTTQNESQGNPSVPSAGISIAQSIPICAGATIAATTTATASSSSEEMSPMQTKPSQWVGSALDEAIKQINSQFISYIYMGFAECPEHALLYFWRLTEQMSYVQLDALWSWYNIGVPPPAISLMSQYGTFAMLLTKCHFMINTPVRNHLQYDALKGDVQKYIHAIDLLVLQRMNAKNQWLSGIAKQQPMASSSVPYQSFVTAASSQQQSQQVPQQKLALPLRQQTAFQHLK